MIEEIKKYIKNSFSILPIKEDKSPATQKWLGVDVNINEFNNCYGIGIKCGKESHGLECMDFDNHFGDAKQILSKYLLIPDVNEIYLKYKLPIESTMNGGYHLLFRCDFNEGNKKLASRPKLDEKNNKWRPDTIIETRGDGGYFVAYPTPKYNVIRNDIFEIQSITKDERNILISNAISFNEWSEPIYNEFEKTDRPGDKYNQDYSSLEDVRSELLNKGWSELRQGFWQRPDKKKGISATLGYIEKIFYVFSSNAYPFEPLKGYTPFQVIALLRYNGNFSDFAKDLSKMYGMDKERDYTQKTENKPKIDLESTLNNCFIDTDVIIEKPPIIMRIAEMDGSYNKKKRLLTLGNFSAITGKGKSKKTFLASMMLASAIRNDHLYHKFYSELPDKKRVVLHFDTEQGIFDSYIVAKRIRKMANILTDHHYAIFNLREFEPKQRCEIIEFALNKFKNDISLVLIDGIVDLGTAINDENEGTRVISLLMKWTKVFNCHIITIIHQNKNDNFATGHIGSSIIKKAETVISVAKDDTYKSRSLVSCDNIRGISDFEDFEFEIDEHGIPNIYNNKYNEMSKELKMDF